MGMGQLGTYFRYLSNNFFPILYLLDELFCLLLNYRNKLRPGVDLWLYLLVSYVNGRNERGRRVKDFYAFPQGF